MSTLLLVHGLVGCVDALSDLSDSCGITGACRFSQRRRWLLEVYRRLLFLWVLEWNVAQKDKHLIWRNEIIAIEVKPRNNLQNLI